MDNRDNSGHGNGTTGQPEQLSNSLSISLSVSLRNVVPINAPPTKNPNAEPVVLQPGVIGGKAHLDQATRAIKNEVDKGKTSSSKGGKKRSANSGDINPRQAQQFKLSDQELENEVLRWFEFSGYWELKVLQQKLGEKSRERLKRVLQKFCNLIKQGPNRNKYHLKDKYKTK